MRRRGGSSLGVRAAGEEKVFLDPLSVPGWDSREKSIHISCKFYMSVGAFTREGKAQEVTKAGSCDTFLDRERINA